MNHSRERWVRSFGSLLCIALVSACPGCGFIADKDLIKVAKLQDSYITRGDLFRILREMPPDERPLIQTRGDLLRVLQDYIHSEIKKSLAQQLASEGKIRVPREQAAQLFDRQNPEFVVDIPNPEDYNLTQGDMNIMREEREIRIDRLQEKLLGEEAVKYRIIEEMRARTVGVTRKEMEQEYRLRAPELKKPETVRFQALGFPHSKPKASAVAARCRQRLDAGEAFGDLVTEYSLAKLAFLLQGAAVNDPRDVQLRNFWLSASGTETGDIIGPLFLKAPGVLATDERGRPVSQRLPSAYVVCKILTHTPEKAKTLEEAHRELLQPLLYAKTLKRLEQEFGVEIYADKLPDPSMYTD